MSGGTPGDEVAVLRYAAPTLVVEWRPALCTHSGRCVGGLPQVFAPTRRPWIDMTAADAEAIAAQVAQCPSGALRAVPVATTDATGTP